MTNSEPTSIDDRVSEKADNWGICVASGSIEALRSQVDRATEYLGQMLLPEQLTSIKNMAAA